MATENLTENGPDSEPETPRYQRPIIEEVANRIRWAMAAVNLIAYSDDLDPSITDSAEGAAEYLQQARELLDDLPPPNPRQRPRDLANCSQREDEKRELVHRLLPLGHQDFNDVIMIVMTLSQVDESERAEGLALLAKYPLKHVLHFLSLRRDGVVRMVEPEGGAA